MGGYVCSVRAVEVKMVIDVDFNTCDKSNWQFIGLINTFAPVFCCGRWVFKRLTPRLPHDVLQLQFKAAVFLVKL